MMFVIEASLPSLFYIFLCGQAGFMHSPGLLEMENGGRDNRACTVLPATLETLTGKFARQILPRVLSLAK